MDNNNKKSFNSEKELKELIINKKVALAELSPDELNNLADYIIDTLDPDSKEDTDLLTQCFAALEAVSENTDTISDERCKELAKGAIDMFSVSCNDIDRKDTKQKKLGFKKAMLIVAAAIAALILAGCVAQALGFNVVDLGKSLLNIPENTVKSEGNIDIVRTDDFAVYNSVEQMMEEESISIQYPGSLPEGYVLDSVQVNKDNQGISSIVCLYSCTDSNICMTCFPYTIDLYSDESETINGITYYFSAIDKQIQVEWAFNEYHYLITSSSKEELTYIINNLKGNPNNDH